MKKDIGETTPEPENGEITPNVYEVELQVRERILGGIPKDEETIRKWLLGKGVSPVEAEKRAKVIKEEVSDEEYADAEEKGSWTGFKMDQTGIYIEPRQIRAMIKESAMVQEITAKVRGIRQRFQHGMVVSPERIYLTRNGVSVKLPDGSHERPIHVMTPMGPKAALSKSDFVTKPNIKFTIKIATPYGKDKTEYITESRLKAILTWATDGIGLGAARSQGEGTFDIVTFKRIA